MAGPGEVQAGAGQCRKVLYPVPQARARQAGCSIVQLVQYLSASGPRLSVLAIYAILFRDV